MVILAAYEATRNEAMNVLMISSLFQNLTSCLQSTMLELHCRQQSSLLMSVSEEFSYHYIWVIMSVWSLITRCVMCVCILNTHCVMSAWSLNTRCVMCVCILNTHCVTSVWSLITRCVMCVCILNTHCVMSAWSLITRCVMCVCILNTHCVMSVWSLNTVMNVHLCIARWMAL